MAVEFPEHLVEEFLLRFPPADPASLVRAALVCKPWCRLVSAPRFRRRFREFHRTPPVLGFVANTTKSGHGSYAARFVSTSSFRAPPHAAAEHRGWLVLDARHGRVLLRSIGFEIRPALLMAWDPVTDDRRYLPEVPSLPLAATGWNAAVLCLGAANGSCCDHLDCQRGPFAVVLVAKSTMMIYRSDAGTWRRVILAPKCSVNAAPTAFVESTLYFLIGRRILGCDLAKGETFVAPLPPDSATCDPVLMTMENGGLGVALGQGSRLALWSMDVETGPYGGIRIRWVQVRVIELDKLLPVKASSIYPTPIGFFPGVFFFNTDDGLFSINLNSDQVKKELENDDICVIKVVPYMSFCTPAPGLTITDEEPAVDGSGA